MRKLALLFVLLLLLQLQLSLWAEQLTPPEQSPFAAYDKAAYNIDRETCRVYRAGPNPGFTGPDVEALHKWMLSRKARGLSVPPIWGYERPPRKERDKPAGTPEKDKEEAKKPDKDGGEKHGDKDGSEKKDDEWPPKEVAAEKDTSWEPTEAELEQVRKLCTAGKNSGENKKFDEARDIAWKLLRKLARSGDKLPTAEWAKRLAAAAKIREAMKDCPGNYAGNGDVCNAMVDDIATEEKHSAMFAKMKWMFDNRSKYEINDRYYRIAAYKYIENHADQFPNDAAKKLFCQQLIKGGIRDKGLQELADSFK